MIGSVRARLTLAVALVVGAIALAVALLAPRMVRDGLVDDRLDAQRDLEAEVVGGFVTTVSVDDLDTLGLTALIGPDVAALVEGLDEADALTELRGYDPEGDLHVLTGPELVATVSTDGRVKVGPLDRLDAGQAVVSVDRLEQLAFDYGVVDPFEFVDPFGPDGLPGLDGGIDELFSGFELFIDDVLDPSLFDELPGFEPGSGIAPSDLADALLDEFAALTDEGVMGTDEMLAAEPPTEMTVGTRTIDGRPRILTASLDGIDGSVDRVRTLLWVGLPIAVLAAAMLTWLLAGRSLHPVAAITEQTRKIRSTTLYERVPVPSSRDEIAALATEMNTMLDRVQREDERRRRFVSDASHELRSPIASIRAQAESELAAAGAHERELAAGVLAEAERMGTLVDDLLALARHDEQLAPPGQLVDLDDVVYAEAARTRRVPVDVTAVSAGQVMGRPGELARMITHLLDNAARHADTQVVVSLTTVDDGVRLIVDDDGPGIAPDDRARIFERFARLDDARTRDHGGAGLGLAVVDAVLQSAGGTIVVGESPAGGARFAVTLPAGGAASAGG